MSQASAITDDRPVESRAQLVEHLESGCKPDRSSWRIGAEHEKFVFHRDDNAPLSYTGENGRPGIRDVLNAFVSLGWKAVNEGENIVAATKDGASITLEPGGQFELSGAPLETIHDTCVETTAHLNEVKKIGQDLNIGFLGLGFHPTITRAEAPVMPKARYDIMKAYMPKVGTLGLDMMFRTCTVQVNLDFASEADMVEKFRLSLALQPLATALFANSPVKEGRTSRFVSLRSNVWTDTDPDRCGMLPFVFEEGFGFERWVDHVLDVPMYFVRREGTFVDCSGLSFRDFLAGNMAALPGEKPTMEDWKDHLTTLFPEVRLKTFLEMRGADGGPWSWLCALPALWVGLLYDADCQQAGLDLVKSWSVDEISKLRDDVPERGLSAELNGRSLKEIGREVLDIASTGLSRRQCTNGAGDTEQGYLKSLYDSIETGRTPACILKSKLENEWDGDVTKIFSELSY